MRSDFWSLPWDAQQAIRRGESDARAARNRARSLAEANKTIESQASLICEAIGALEAAERIVTSDVEACRAFAAPGEEPSEPEKALEIIVATVSKLKGES